MSDLDFAEVLTRMVQMGASDVHMTAGFKPAVRVRGQITALEDLPVLTPQVTRETVYSILNDDQRKRFENHLQLDFAYAIPNVARFRVKGAKNIDWEDLASFDLGGRHYLMVADTGDNGGLRRTLQLHAFEEPARLRDGGTLEPAWSIAFRWPDGPRDCEAVAVDAAAGRVLLVSKKRRPPELFDLPLHPPDGAAM